MPPLEYVPPLPPIGGSLVSGPREYGASRPVHPSPSLAGLRLEALSGKERRWWGRRFGFDLPYLATPAGWGEWLPITTGTIPRFVVELPHQLSN